MKNTVSLKGNAEAERVSKTFRLLPETAQYLDELAKTTILSHGQIVDFAIAYFKVEREKGNKVILEVEI